MLKINWNKTEQEYISTTISYRALAKKYSVSYSSIRRVGGKNNWIKKREEYNSRVTQIATKININKSVDDWTTRDQAHRQIADYMVSLSHDCLMKVVREIKERSDFNIVNVHRAIKTVETSIFLERKILGLPIKHQQNNTNNRMLAFEFEFKQLLDDKNLLKIAKDNNIDFKYVMSLVEREAKKQIMR